MVCVPSHEKNVKPEQPKSQTVESGPPQSNALMRAIAAVKSFTGEIELAELLNKLMLAMLEISPAQRGCLLLKTAEEWTVEAAAEKLGQHSQRVKILAGNQAPDLCRTMVELAIRHETTVVAHNACAEERFRADAYVQKHRPKSILCLVINHQQEMLCLVYLENKVRPDAFDHQARELLGLLALQAGVSIKNALLYRQLDNTVSELHKEIAKRKDTQLQLMRAGKLSALGRLSASLAHEFGNPLMGITYLLEDLSGRPALSEHDRHLISVGLEDCRRMRNLLDELHSLHKPSRKTRTRFSLNEAVSEVLLLQRQRLLDSGIVVHTELAAGLPNLYAVRDQILRVIGALIENGAQAMADDGGLHLKTARHGDLIELHIADRGCGIAPDQQEQIFEPFFTADDISSGDGLELAIAYFIIKNHGGEITFRSAAGVGSTFSISLPVPYLDETMGAGATGRE